MTAAEITGGRFVKGKRWEVSLCQNLDTFLSTKKNLKCRLDLSLAYSSL